VVGTSIAYHLARRGAGRGVVLLERDSLAGGSTGRSAGGIRSQFSTEINIRLSLESVAFWRRFEDELGLPVDYHEIGYLFLGRSAEDRAQFERNIALQRSFGVPSVLVEPDAIPELVPGIRVDDLSGAAYNATDATAGPNEATLAFARRAREAGVEIVEDSEVVAIDVDAGRVRGVRTTDGSWSAPVVIDAAGPWAGVVGRLAGVDVPVKPYRREIFVSEPFDGLPGRLPLVIDLAAGWYFRREGGSILMAGNKDSHSSFDTHVDWSGLATVAGFATNRMPVFEHLTFGARAWAGLYDVSPDDHAILGEAPAVGGFFLACGFSGHGFQHSPATGRLLADLILDGRCDGIDIEPLGVGRFESGALLDEPLTAHAGTLGG
jgi:sarcosine oxidase subunit beta